MSFKEIISIHGAPRSGTSWLGQIFDSSPDVRYKFQPLFSYAFKDRIDLQSSKEEILNYYKELYDYEDEFLDQLDKIEEGVYPDFKNKRDNPEFLVTKMVRYHFLIPYLLEEIDIIKFIGIVRHPCGVLNSWKNAPREFLKEWNFDEEWRFAQSMNEFRPEQYYGFNRWKEATKLFLEMEKNYSDRFKLIQYEELVKDPFAIAKEVLRFCEIDWSEQTEEFLRKSISVEQEDVYSVYKGKKDVYNWQNTLKQKIIDQIKNELEETEFQRFL